MFSAENNDYALKVKSAYDVPSNGTYKFDISSPTIVTQQQVDAYNAELLYFEAGKLRKNGQESLTKKAIEKYKELFSVYQKIDDNRKCALTLTQLGRAYESLGDHENTISSLDKALNFADPERKARILNILGLSYYEIGEIQKSLDIENQALALMKEVGDKDGEADTLSTIGSGYWYLLNPEKAKDFYYQALEIWRPLGLGVDLTLNNLGSVCDDLGEYEESKKYYEESLRLLKVRNDKTVTTSKSEDQLITTIMFGRNRAFFGDFETSISLYSEALTLVDVVGNIRIKGVLFSEMGNMNLRLGKIAEAKKLYEDAIPLSNQSKDKKGASIAHIGLGKVLSIEGNNSQALEHLEKGLTLTREVGEQFIEMDALYGEALIYAKEHKIQKSLQITKQILEILESIRSRLYTFKSKTGYFASVKDYYDLYIDNLVELKGEAVAAKEAFSASERAKARAFTEDLSELSGKIDNKIDPKMNSEHKELLAMLSVKLQSKLDVIKENDKTKLQQIDNEINKISEKIEIVERDIAKLDTNYASVKYSPSVTLGKVQHDLVENNTVLLEYFTGKRNSYVWVIGSNFSKMVRLSNSSDIEKLGLEVQDLLTQRAKKIHLEDEKEKLERIKLADEKIPEKLKTLSQLVLDPIKNEISGKTILLVPDGVLNYLPFSALYDPKDQAPMVMSHEILNVPSASALWILQSQSNKSASYQKTLAIFADPIFTKKDPRCQKKDNVEELALNKNEVRTSERSFEGFFNRDSDGRIPYSRVEADLLAKSVAPDQVKVYLDSLANLENFKDSGMGMYRIIHLAIHGLFSADHPELSGLMFSRYNERGETQNGFISASEIYTLKFPVELVVLSACSTGLGKAIKGEGVVGLTRGFMYAGAKRVVVSLWSVNDKATSELMTVFYKQMLTNKQSPSQALRLAQIEMLKSDKWKNPYYWAPFVIHGQYK